MNIFPRLILSLIIIVAGCKSQSNETDKLKPGSICLITDGYGTYGAVKILAIDKESVQIKIYTNRFRSRPESIELNKLDMGSSTANNLGIMKRRDFDMWKPVEMNFEKVTKEDFTP